MSGHQTSRLLRQADELTFRKMSVTSLHAVVWDHSTLPPLLYRLSLGKLYNIVQLPYSDHDTGASLKQGGLIHLCVNEMETIS